MCALVTGDDALLVLMLCGCAFLEMGTEEGEVWLGHTE